jgi:hypothetical protein
MQPMTFGPILNNEPWIFAALVTDLVEENPQDLSNQTFAFEVTDQSGKTVLSATTASKNLFTAPGAGVIGWAFTQEEMSKLPAGAYQASLEVNKDGEPEPVDIGHLAALQIVAQP